MAEPERRTYQRPPADWAAVAEDHQEAIERLQRQHEEMVSELASLRGTVEDLTAQLSERTR